MKFVIPKLSVIFIAASLFSSCEQEEDLYSSFPVNNEQTAASSFQIPVDSALATLYNFMADADCNGSRSNSSRKVVEVTTVHTAKVLSRSNNIPADCDNLLYIANFEDEQGYAILAADKRIGEKVIAITDKGSLNANQINSNSNYQTEDSVRPFFKDYPATGPGFFTLPEYGDELFMNPNTVNLEVEGEGVLVGSYNDDDEGESIRPGGPIFPSSTQLPASLCIDYALSEINNFDDDDSNDNGIREIITDWDYDSTGNNFPRSRTEVAYSSWRTLASSPNLLEQYVNWHQSTPFNDMCPSRRKWIVVGHKRTAKAGCFPLSIAKVFTHLEYPNTYTYNGYTVSWAGLKSSKYLSLIDKTSAAALLRGIGSGCDSWYFYGGTFTFPWKGTAYMRSMGLKNAHSYAYKYERVTSMIDDNKPLLIYAMPKLRLDKSHCWNIDGYKEKERTVRRRVYMADSLISETYHDEKSKMIHCDFGWGGEQNGYYVSGVFKLNDYASEKDSPNNPENKTNYDNYLYIVMY